MVLLGAAREILEKKGPVVVTETFPFSRRFGLQKTGSSGALGPADWRGAEGAPGAGLQRSASSSRLEGASTQVSAGGRPGEQTLPSGESSCLSPLSAGPGAPSCQSPPHPLPEGAGARLPVSMAGQPLRGGGQVGVPVLYPGFSGVRSLPPTTPGLSFPFGATSKSAQGRGVLASQGPLPPLPPSSLTQALRCDLPLHTHRASFLPLRSV